MELRLDFNMKLILMSRWWESHKVNHMKMNGHLIDSENCFKMFFLLKLYFLLFNYGKHFLSCGNK